MKRNHKVRCDSLFAKMKPYQREMVWRWAYVEAVSLRMIQARIADQFGIVVPNEKTISMLLGQLSNRFVFQKAGQFRVGDRVLIEVALLQGGRVAVGLLPAYSTLKTHIRKSRRLGRFNCPSRSQKSTST